jgi:membrane protein DedA with SNARE-associated domain
MTLAEYVILFVFVAIMGAGLPGPGDASLIAAGTLAGEGQLNVGIVVATAGVAWMLGSVVGYLEAYSKFSLKKYSPTAAR